MNFQPKLSNFGWSQALLSPPAHALGPTLTHPFISVQEKDVRVRLKDSGLSAKEIASRLERGQVVTPNLAARRPRKLDMHSILV
jgi:hypothetical protein